MRDEREYFTPIAGTTYDHRCAGRFRCLYVIGAAEAIFENVRSGWTFKAHGIVIYPRGAIDWYFSTDGHFKKRV